MKNKRSDMEEEEMKALRRTNHSKYALYKAAQAWCTPKTEKVVMIPELAEEFAEMLDEILSEHWLGNVTTRELLQELTARIEANGDREYRPSERTSSSPVLSI